MESSPLVQRGRSTALPSQQSSNKHLRQVHLTTKDIGRLPSTVKDDGGLECVTAVVVTFNGDQWIEACLASLAEAGIRNIIVVDNASSDATARIASLHYSRPHVESMSQNLGFGAGNNLGIQLALERGAKWTLLVNQDLVLHSDAARRLYEAASKSPGYGILSAFQFTYDGLSIDPAFFGYVPREYYSDLVRQEPIRTVYECDFMPAACVLVSKDLWLIVGGFDPLFFMYGEDDDLCNRARKAGFHAGVVPRALVNHWHGLLRTKQTLAKEINFECSRRLLEAKELSTSGGPVRVLTRLLLRRVEPWTWKMRARRFLVSIASWAMLARRLSNRQRNDSCHNSRVLDIKTFEEAADSRLHNKTWDGDSTSSANSTAALPSV
jgi:GT2 family glycosyltransferase